MYEEDPPEDPTDVQLRTEAGERLRADWDAGPSHSAHAPRAVARPTIRYEYIGNTGLTVFGGATRPRYRFAYPGAQVAVDARDGASLDGVPNLNGSPAESQMRRRL